jgi:alkanesulfonate monooxygenase SsuD/methylene tetrahydromethanopterin reductase-like flavin-dependent oxidoreductase (luciferase family)
MARIAEYAEGWLPILVPEFDERLAQLTEECAKRGRSIADIDITVYAMIESAEQLAGLAEKGVNRVVLGLPTVGETESLAILDGYANIVEWGRQIAA